MRHIRPLHQFVIALISGILIAACQPASTISPAPAIPGWSVVQLVVYPASPIFRPALVINAGKPIAGWWSLPGGNAHGNAQLILSAVNSGSTPVPATGISGQTPDQLTLFATRYGILALWRDQDTANVDPADRRLYVALFNADLSMARPPRAITDQPTDAYAAFALPSGDIAIAWTAHSGAALDSLLISTVDASGTRAYGSPQPIAYDVSRPALSGDSSGRLIVGWLSPQPGSTWAVQVATVQTSISPTHNLTLQADSIATLGFLQPGGSDDSRLIDNFTLVSDGTTCETLWSTVSLANSESADISDFTFPCASIGDSLNPPNSRALFPTQNHLIDQARWPTDLSIIQQSGAAIPIGVTITESGGDVPAVVWLRNSQIQKTDRLAAADPHVTVGSLALAADPNTGQISALWSQINPDGSITLNIALSAVHP